MRRPKLFERGSRLALRIYLIGLVQFLVVAIGLEMNRRAGAPRIPPPIGPDVHYVADTLARVAEDPPLLAQELDRVRSIFHWAVTVRDDTGEVLGQTRPEELPSGKVIVRGSLPVTFADGRGGTVDYVVPLRGPRPRAGPGFVVPIALILLVVGVASILTSRALTKPLARLTQVARDFGAGKLDARAHMKRSDELGEMARTFDDMADRIAALLLAEKELLANVSHELRTPLARIRVALDLANEADPRDAVESLGDIAEDLGELERLVDDVLAAARLALDDGPSSRTSLPIRREHLELGELIEKAMTKFRGAHPNRTLRVQIEADLPPVLGDAILLRRVVDNLLDNAHKYTEDASQPIAIVVRRESDGVTIEVQDRGVGVAEEDVKRVFEPFFRADRSRTRSTGGLGLGLALSRRVVEAHGGTIAFESKLGAGTIARVHLPSAAT
ncbi:periplasmic sensor signal transduction histidine kinase [Labilithrix luteola]|uniref:histidine kinase n=1 Tax=Labilithrix luteola TaxID=1391654 RepID=A0A0K1QGD3_9BACT|nr:HAMP domain-containing sensor histidine kinase [Labilithrix luteola]AKV04500.1 periplasmic sensor signal transduction histidine kinase [Labilithrix luteola]